MKLNELARNIDIRFTMPIETLSIRGITSSSKEVRDGWLFVAIRGTVQDGHSFIADACKRGACAVIVEEIVKNIDPGIPMGITKNSRTAYAALLQTFYGYPSKKLNVIGITGTNGKTTTAYLLRHIFEARAKVGLIGTIQALIGEESFELNNTTPDLGIITRLMAKMREKECAFCIMEVSSHALDQGRILSTQFVARVFTNLTQDHLDYHKTMEAYYESKKRLFTDHSDIAVSIVNIDDPYGRRLLTEIKGDTLSYGCSLEADVRAYDINIAMNKITMNVRALDSEAHFSVPLTAQHNVYNVLAAIATALSMGFTLDEIRTRLAIFPGVKGRMECVSADDQPYVFVDYAHTPDAVENVLSAMRALHTGQLIAILGCGGDRDKGKRPIMGAIAANIADKIIITNDNPRTEDPDAIIAEIVGGITPDVFTAKCTIIKDRQQAIEQTCANLQPGSIVLILGKGHEDYQIIGKEKRHFSDQDIARKALRRENAYGK